MRIRIGRVQVEPRRCASANEAERRPWYFLALHVDIGLFFESPGGFRWSRKDAHLNRSYRGKSRNENATGNSLGVETNAWDSIASSRSAAFWKGPRD